MQDWRDWLDRYALRRPYRRASVLLAFASVSIPLSTALLPADALYVTLWAAIAAFLGMWAYLALVALTYCRLKRGVVSSAWLILMLLPLSSIGPALPVAGPISLYPVGALIALLPVVIAWTAQDRGETGRSIAAQGSARAHNE
ncbi:hypothetical protein [Sphingosinicella sp. BN140058]|uniref:hypothetical protein n=1 Tax=Sphingosinicella sp. BN140058 TaxID=1892855 RepID=UPI001010E75B|nr:hypothetical protein [Sphingosinicella sp. BN140058]QAY75181.1 hypothetical protein ETR14_00525 [Sphingosinicella sp. BN140058]